MQSPQIERADPVSRKLEFYPTDNSKGTQLKSKSRFTSLEAMVLT
jgi:hypothetical protein